MMRPTSGARPLPRLRQPVRPLGGRAAGAFGRSEALALGALGFIVGVTVVWWAVALWPASPATPAWLQTARAVCFGAHEQGLPGAGGWILLIGEPIGMVAALYIIWGEAVGAGVRRLGRSAWGRTLLGAAGAILLVGAGMAGWRIVTASAADARAAAPGPGAAPMQRPLAGAAPPIQLLDQHGKILTLERFRGRPVLVTFAYAHCETVCPLVVRDAERARQRLDPAPALVVITLDPWRDVPSRLPHIADAWQLEADSFVVSGDVDEVQRVLRSWRMETARDERNGDIVHAPVTYVVRGDGRLAFATSGRWEELVEAVERLR